MTPASIMAPQLIVRSAAAQNKRRRHLPAMATSIMSIIIPTCCLLLSLCFSDAFVQPILPSSSSKPTHNQADRASQENSNRFGVSHGHRALQATTQPSIDLGNSHIVEEIEADTILEDGNRLLYISLSKLDHDDTNDGDPFLRGILVEPPRGETQGDARQREGLISAIPSDNMSKDVLVNGTAKILDSILLQHLILERGDDSCGPVDLIVRIDASEMDDNTCKCIKHGLESRGLVQNDDHGDLFFYLDYGKVVESYSSLAWYERGTQMSLSALEILSLLSSRRIKYDFDAIRPNANKERNIVAVERDLLPAKTTASVLDIMVQIESNGWLARNLDSVDNLPSLHLNLVSGGKPIFPPLDEISEEKNNNSGTFERSVQKLWSLVKPHLEGKLLTRVRGIMKSSTVEISDVFIRRYGEDIRLTETEDDVATRYGISAHYDITASTTSVIALDDVAAEGQSGLYTTESDRASNHAALRRYFPLSAGDAVIHTWDVLHGVEINPSQQRTSLIVWFEDRGDGATEPTCASVYPSWLASPSDDDDIGMFVLATAVGNPADDVKESGMKNEHPHDLYLQSALMGNNAFALTSLGALCNEGAISPDRLEGIKTFLGVECSEKDVCDIAIDLWHAASMLGNPLAQTSLGDELMARSMKKLHDSENDALTKDMRLRATVLFALAAQQGYDDARQALPRVLDVESTQHSSAEEFYESPVFQAAQVAMLV